MEIFLKLIDRLIQLVRARSLHRKQLFNEIVQPIYEDLEPIAKDYFELFHFVISRLESESSTREELADLTKERSLQFVALRRKLQEAAQVVAGRIEDERIVEFANAVTSFFFPSGFYVNASPYHFTQQIFSDKGFEFYQVPGPQPFDPHPKMPVSQFIAAKQELDERWRTISRLYYEIRIDYAANAETA
jgi:hypothetical protein